METIKFVKTLFPMSVCVATAGEVFVRALMTIYSEAKVVYIIITA